MSNAAVMLLRVQSCNISRREDVARQMRGNSEAMSPYYLSFAHELQTGPIRFGCISKHSDCYVELESDYQNPGLNLTEKSL